MVTMRYWAAAKEAAGCAEEQAAAATLAELLGEVVDRRTRADRSVEAERLRRVLGACSFLVDGVSTGRRTPEQVPLADAMTVEALPPFAGG